MRKARHVAAGITFCFSLAAGAAMPGRVAAEREPGGGQTLTHEVRKGDNLHIMAGYYYRNPREWKRIFDRNSATLVDPNVVSPGMVLHIEADPERQWDIPYEEFLSRIFD